MKPNFQGIQDKKAHLSTFATLRCGCLITPIMYVQTKLLHTEKSHKCKWMWSYLNFPKSWSHATFKCSFIALANNKRSKMSYYLYSARLFTVCTKWRCSLDASPSILCHLSVTGQFFDFCPNVNASLSRWRATVFPSSVSCGAHFTADR